MKNLIILLSVILLSSCVSIKQNMQKDNDDYTVAKMVYEATSCPKESIRIKHQCINSKGTTVYQVGTCCNDMYVHKTNNSFTIMR